MNTTYTAKINGIAYRPTSDSLPGIVREIARELSVNGIRLEDLSTDQTSINTWNVIHEGVIATVTTE